MFLQRWGISEFDESVPQSRRFLAVPFLGLDVPSTNSEFSNPEVELRIGKCGARDLCISCRSVFCRCDCLQVIIGLTVLAYRHEGLRLSDVTYLVQRCKEALIQELGPIKHRPTFLLYASWTSIAEQLNEGQDGAATPASCLPLQFARPDDFREMQRVHDVLTHFAPSAMHMLQQLVFPMLMKHQAAKITASGCDLGKLVPAFCLAFLAIVLQRCIIIFIVHCARKFNAV